MIGGLTKSTSRLALLAGIGLFAGSVSSAQAADLGGDCCADLEERIAELEATTARKGNRKVSLTISGQVHQMVLFWDDGFESNAYVVDNVYSSTRFRFTGSAKIAPDWTAGYYIEIEAFTNASNAVNQANDDAGSNINLRQSNWWIESKQLGRLTVGQASPATDDIILADVAGATPGGFSDQPLVGGGFFLRNAGVLTTTNYSAFAPTLDTARRNIVRYDSPTFQGAKIVATWGEDDFWDVALWWSGEHFGIKYAGGTGYLRNTDQAEAIRGRSDYEEFKGSSSFLHVASGLFIDYAYVHREYDGVPGLADLDYYYVRGGIVAKISPLGKTVFFGQYGNGNDGLVGATAGGFGAGIVTDSELEIWGLGVTQHIDAAAMEMYLTYNQFNAELTTTLADFDFDETHFVLAGARIKF